MGTARAGHILSVQPGTTVRSLKEQIEGGASNV